jgi:hypothetical protein
VIATQQLAHNIERRIANGADSAEPDLQHFPRSVMTLSPLSVGRELRDATAPTDPIGARPRRARKLPYDGEATASRQPTCDPQPLALSRHETTPRLRRASARCRSLGTPLRPAARRHLG